MLALAGHTSEQRTLSKTKNNRLTGKAPYKSAGGIPSRASADGCAGIWDDENRPSGGGDDMIGPEPGHAVRVIPGILPKDRQIGRLGELDYLRHAGVIDDVPFAIEPARL